MKKLNRKLITASALIALLVASTGCVEKELHNGRVVTMAMSPCSCKMSGGCGASWRPRGDGLYADKTAPEDYDAYGQYKGSMMLPEECRAN